MIQKGPLISLVTDYFLLYHGINLRSKETVSIDEKLDDEAFFEVSALILSLNRKTFDAMASLKSFHELSERLTQQKIDSLDSLYRLQHSVIKHFLEHRCQSTVNHLHQSFIYLQTEGLIDKLSFEKLVSLFHSSAFVKEKAKELPAETLKQNFQEAKHSIFTDIDELKSVLRKSDELDHIADYLNNQKFSIGITGVMNAGKSTMLNALMGEAILGTSVIPETANLTLVKFSETPSAKVVYWSVSEWQRIEESAKGSSAISTFVTETKNHFKENLESFILAVSREEEIQVEDLSLYTSASLSEKRCNLVKRVELGSPLHFLEEGIEIVDTPGLDDVVVQREEITKEYLAKCDVLIHLMNVSQSATAKDIEFIIDAVLYQNITKVLIVITRVDMVDSKDVQEVIEYTKESISSKLHEQNSDSKLDFVLQSLNFIALSGKMALLHRTGHADEAEDAGYTLEKTGILKVENYLQETLFSNKNERSSLILRSAKNRLAKALKTELTELKLESSLLYKTKDEVDRELELLKSKKTKQEESLKYLEYQITGYEAEIKNYLERLQHFLKNELKTLQTTIKQRLMDETFYSLETNKKTPKLSDQTRIIQTALKNGIVDIIREYRYKFIKKSSKISQSIAAQYDEIAERSKEEYGSFEHETIFGDAFNRGFLTAENSTLINRVSKVLQSATLGKLAKIDEQISLVVKEEFVYLQTQVKEKALTLSQKLLEEFFANLRAPIDFFQNNLARNEALLLHHIEFLKEDESTRNAKAIELYESIKTLERIAKRYAL